jgi:hypothetical protein
MRAARLVAGHPRVACGVKLFGDGEVRRASRSDFISAAGPAKGCAGGLDEGDMKKRAVWVASRESAAEFQENPEKTADCSVVSRIT